MVFTLQIQCYINQIQPFTNRIWNVSNRIQLFGVYNIVIVTDEIYIIYSSVIIYLSAHKNKVNLTKKFNEDEWKKYK